MNLKMKCKIKNILIIFILSSSTILFAGNKFLSVFYAVSSNNSKIFQTKITELNKSTKIQKYLKYSYQGHYASSSHTLNIFIFRLNEINKLQIPILGEKHQIYASSTISIKAFKRKYKEALKHKELTDLNLIMYYATSKHNILQFMKRYNAIKNIKNEEIIGTSYLLFARSNINIDLFFKKINNFNNLK